MLRSPFEPEPARSLHILLCRLLSCLLIVCPVLLGTQARAADSPGDTLPPVGRSLFDTLLATNGGGAMDVPFPFSELITHIRARVDNAGPSGGVSVVLIPLGRSLQRHAAGDAEAFRYPRVVAAVTGEPPAGAPPGHLYLKDRLYVAYNERAAALEVISYNEDAARFEFQLVRNYRDGVRAETGYANRTVCLACHHNAAPIFSRQSWDETSANPVIAARLEATGETFFGLPWRHGVDVPDAIDAATKRANLFATAQQLWQQGCAAQTDATSIACRAEVLKQALRYRLSHSGAGELDAAARTRLAGPLLTSWQKRWPDGLPIPDPQLPNRQPFAGLPTDGRTPDKDALYLYADIGAAFDPLALRAPLEIWPGRSDADVWRFIQVLALFFSRADIHTIDRHLSRQPGTTVSGLTLDCTERIRTDPGRVDIDCSDDKGSSLQARIRMQAGKTVGGDVDRLTLQGQHLGGPIALSASGHAITNAPTTDFTPDSLGHGVRTGAGQSIRRLTLQRATSASPAQLRLELHDDLKPLDEAIERLAIATRSGAADALSELPLRRSVVLDAVFEQLGIQRDVRRTPATALSPPQLADPAPRRPTVWPVDLQPFARQCRQCHDAASDFPPGFLHGDDAQVRQQLSSCAERMYYRLQMNLTPAAGRSKTPMPPPAAAHAAALAESADLPAMLGAVSTLLVQQGRQPGEVMSRPYATLRPCLAERGQLLPGGLK